MRGLRSIVAAVGVLLTASIAQAGNVSIHDGFDGPSLDPAWDVAFSVPGRGAQNTSAWTYSFASGAFVVEDITPIGFGPPWSLVSMSRSIKGGAADFSVALQMGWSSPFVTDMMDLVLAVYAADGIIGRVEYHDAWDGSRGEWVAEDATSYDYRTNANSLGTSGTETLAMSRTGDSVSFLIGGATVLTLTDTRPVTRIALEFGYYSYPGSTFGDFKLYDLDATLAVVPLPPSALMGLGVLGGLGLVRWSRRRRTA